MIWIKIKNIMFKVSNLKIFIVFYFGDSLEDQCYFQYFKFNVDQIEVYYLKVGFCKYSIFLFCFFCLKMISFDRLVLVVIKL